MVHLCVNSSYTDVTIEVSTEEDVIYESAGNIMICATIDAGVEFDETCPIEPSFNLTATTVEGKASVYNNNDHGYVCLFILSRIFRI